MEDSRRNPAAEDPRDVLDVIRPFCASRNAHLRGNALHALAVLTGDEVLGDAATEQLANAMLAEQAAVDRDWARTYRDGLTRALAALDPHLRRSMLNKARHRLAEVGDPLRHGVLFEVLLRQLDDMLGGERLTSREFFRFAGPGAKSNYLTLAWEAGWRLFVAGAIVTLFTFMIQPTTAVPAEVTAYRIFFLMLVAALHFGFALKFSFAGRPPLTWRQMLIDSASTTLATALLAILWRITSDVRAPTEWVEILSGGLLGAAVGAACRLIRWLPRVRISESEGSSPWPQIALGMIAAFILCYLASAAWPLIAADMMVGLVPLGGVIGWLNTWLEQRRPELIVEDRRPAWAGPLIVGACGLATAMLVSPLLVPDREPKLDTRNPTWTVQSGVRYRVRSPDGALYRLTALERLGSYGPVLTISGPSGGWNSTDDALMDVNALATDATEVGTEPRRGTESGPDLPSVGPAIMAPGTTFCAGRNASDCAVAGVEGVIANYLFGWLGRDRRPGVPIRIRVERIAGE